MLKNHIDSLESQVQQLEDEAIRAKTSWFKSCLFETDNPVVNVLSSQPLLIAGCLVLTVFVGYSCFSHLSNSTDNLGLSLESKLNTFSNLVRDEALTFSRHPTDSIQGLNKEIKVVIDVCGNSMNISGEAIDACLNLERKITQLTSTLTQQLSTSNSLATSLNDLDQKLSTLTTLLSSLGGG